MADQIDTKVVNKLAEILDQHGLTELEYEMGECRICLTKEPFPSRQIATVMPTTPLAVASPAAAEQTVKKDDEVDETSNPNAIKSPMVGVVYLSPDATKSNYVKIGTTVAEGDTLCLIEAMKTFNPVKANKGGKITKILVENGDPVEYGQPLFVVE